MGKTANIAALGYAAFAVTLWLASMGPAGWFEPSSGQPATLLIGQSGNMLLPLVVLVLGGGVLAVAGIGQWLGGRGLDASLFLAFAGYWWIAALGQHALDTFAAGPMRGFVGWYDALWALLAFCIWLAAWKADMARMLFTAGLSLMLAAFALASWLHFGAVEVLGGYIGLVTAVLGIYIFAAEIINQVHGGSVLPLGEPGNHPTPSA
jgi:succinate-acetate transporter protein